MDWQTVFLLYQWYVQYQRLQEMTIFDWYTTAIWYDGIRITNFFIFCAHYAFSKSTSAAIKNYSTYRTSNPQQGNLDTFQPQPSGCDVNQVDP